MGYVKRYVMLALAVTSWMLPLPGATLERLSLDDIISRSTSIVRGKVAASWAAYTGSVIYTHYQIQVSEQFKGGSGNSLEVMTPGGTVKGLKQSFSGSPVLNQGDEFVFFLWTSKGGITWITGLTQGLFSVAAAADGDPTATRAASRELMLDRNTSRLVKDAALVMKLSDLRSRIASTLAAQEAK
jgi:hypothetical protein